MRSYSSAPELRTGPTPELPSWAKQDRLISVNKWADQEVIGADSVRFVITQYFGDPDGLFHVWYRADGRTKEIPNHVLIRTGDGYMETVKISQLFDSDRYLVTGKWFFPGAAAVVGLFDDTVIELYE